MSEKPIFIAEIKQRSMFGFESKYSRTTLIDTALHYGDWISTHTDPRFGGSFDDIYLLRRETNKPILAKGFHTHYTDIKKCFDNGATYVLTFRPVRYILQYKDIIGNLEHILFETNDKKELNNKNKFVCNGRDLRTGKPKEYSDYLEFRQRCKWLCGASLIKKPEDVQKLYPNSDAFIVGENLVEYCKELPKG
jgi:indole-3-glycerol phosphate synthase